MLKQLLCFLLFISPVYGQAIKAGGSASMMIDARHKDIGILQGEFAILRSTRLCGQYLVPAKKKDWKCLAINKRQLKCEADFICVEADKQKNREEALVEYAKVLKKHKERVNLKNWKRPKVVLKRNARVKFANAKARNKIKQEIVNQNEYQEIENLLATKKVVDINSRQKPRPDLEQEKEKPTYIVNKTVGTRNGIATYEMVDKEEVEKEKKVPGKWYYDQWSFGVLSITDENDNSMGSGFIQWSPYKLLNSRFSVRWNLLVHQIQAFVDEEEVAGYEGTLSFFGEARLSSTLYAGAGLGMAILNSVESNSSLQYWGELGWQNKRPLSLLKRIFLAAQKSSSKITSTKVMVGVTFRF